MRACESHLHGVCCCVFTKEKNKWEKNRKEIEYFYSLGETKNSDREEFYEWDPWKNFSLI